METAPNLIYTPGRMHTKEPGRMARHSLAAVARGSRGAMFFQWRAPRGGAELFHSALVPHAGPDSRVFREAVALGEQLRRVAEAAAGRVQAQVAIGYDEPSAWALQAPALPATGLNPLDEARRAHRALWRRGITADVVGSVEDLSAYPMVVLPAHYLMSDAQADALRSWVAAGGRLVATYLSGVADEHARIRPGGYPGALRELLGIRVEELHPVAPGAVVRLSTGGTADLWSETVHALDAEVVVTYVGGVLDGRPAITRRRHGLGVAWYVSTRLDEPGYDALLTAVAASAGVDPACAGLPPGVEAVRRSGPDASWLFLLNHTDAAADVPADGLELLTGATVAGRVHVPPGGVAVLRTTP
jgi:beta-galactosidase